MLFVDNKTLIWYSFDECMINNMMYVMKHLNDMLYNDKMI